jgi:hypothetical protein
MTTIGSKASHKNSSGVLWIAMSAKLGKFSQANHYLTFNNFINPNSYCHATVLLLHVQGAAGHLG